MNNGPSPPIRDDVLLLLRLLHSCPRLLTRVAGRWGETRPPWEATRLLPHPRWALVVLLVTTRERDADGRSKKRKTPKTKGRADRGPNDFRVRYNEWEKAVGGGGGWE